MPIQISFFLSFLLELKSVLLLHYEFVFSTKLEQVRKGKITWEVEVDSSSDIDEEDVQ